MGRKQPSHADAVEDSPKDEAPIRLFERSLPMLLMRAREGVMQRFRPHLRAHDITEQQWRILRVLAECETVDMLELARRCFIKPPSLSRTIQLLIKRGLVRRRADTQDMRRMIVKLTAEGRKLFTAMAAESVTIYDALEADIGTGQLQNIYKTLHELIDCLGAGDLAAEED